MIISMDIEKTLDKNLTCLYDQSPRQCRPRDNTLNIIKATCEKPTVNIILTGENLEAAPVRSRTRQGVSTVPTHFQYCAWSTSWSNKAREGRGIQIGKEVKLSLFADDMILYIRDPKIRPKNSRYDKQIQQDSESTCTNQTYRGREHGHTPINNREIKYLGKKKNLTSKVKDF